MRITPHDRLVKKARGWLLKHRHVIVISEMASGGGEEPDAIGFQHGADSTVIECKASRSDFLRERHKSHARIPEQSMGNYRYFLAPKDLIKLNELLPADGLLELDENGRIRETRGAMRKERNLAHEYVLLCSCIRRLFGWENVRGVSVKCYRYQTKNRATVIAQPLPKP